LPTVRPKPQYRRAATERDPISHGETSISSATLPKMSTEPATNASIPATVRGPSLRRRTSRVSRAIPASSRPSPIGENGTTGSPDRGGATIPMPVHRGPGEPRAPDPGLRRLERERREPQDEQDVDPGRRGGGVEHPVERPEVGEPHRDPRFGLGGRDLGLERHLPLGG